MFQSQNSYLRTIVVPSRYPTLAAITGIFNDLNILALQLGLKETAIWLPAFSHSVVTAEMHEIS
jgi:hypothetical protein